MELKKKDSLTVVMSVRTAAREFFILTSGLAEPKDHVELALCVFNNEYSRINYVALQVWASVSESKRAKLSDDDFSRALSLLKFFDNMAKDAEKSESPTSATSCDHAAIVTEIDVNIEPLELIETDTE